MLADLMDDLQSAIRNGKEVRVRYLKDRIKEVENWNVSGDKFVH